MNKPYHCPNCKTNKTRFNIIEQKSKIVKLNSETGEILSEHTTETIEPFHMVYRGPGYKVQCGVCGLIEDEKMFANYANFTNERRT